MAYSRLNNPKETKAAAEELAEKISGRKAGNRALVLALTGDLGSGKTTFIKFLARSLGVRSKLLSPTFLIMRGFKINNRDIPYDCFYHIDAYRLKNADDLLSLGFDDILRDNRNIVAIEWSDRIKGILSQNRINLFFKHGKREQERTLTIKK